MTLSSSLEPRPLKTDKAAEEPRALGTARGNGDSPQDSDAGSGTRGVSTGENMTLPSWLKDLPTGEKTHLLTVLINAAPMWSGQPDLKALYDALVSQ